MRYLLPLLFVTSPVFAQGTALPIQDERLNIAACVVSVNDLPASYRAQLYDACINIPKNLCQVRGTSDTCLQDTSLAMHRFYLTARTQLPEQIAASALAQRSYSREMRRIAKVFEHTDCTDNVCTFDAYADALKSLFRQARRAGITLTLSDTK